MSNSVQIDEEKRNILSFPYDCPRDEKIKEIKKNLAQLEECYPRLRYYLDEILVLIEADRYS